MPNDIVVHPDPVWRDRANFVIAAKINSDSTSAPGIEQLWARKIDDFRFELCCVPFFLYDIALGDEIITGISGEDEYLLKSVVERSGRFVFRVWLSDSASRDDVVNQLVRLGCLIESRGPSSRLLAIDAESRELAQRTANALQELESLGELRYETGRLESEPS